MIYPNIDGRTYRKLATGFYRVQEPNRGYSWGEKEWERLWGDILSTLPVHYMGCLVLQTADNRIYEVIDGQQRLTTISLIVLAAMRLLRKFANEGKNTESNRARLDQLRATYISYLDPVTLTSRNKLSLNCNDDSYYRDYLVTLVDHLPQRGFPASTQAMREGFEWFECRLREHVRNSADPGMALAQFIETMSDKLFFTVIMMPDQFNANKVQP